MCTEYGVYVPWLYALCGIRPLCTEGGSWNLFSAVDRIGICSQGEEDASRWNLHLIAGSTDPQLLFLIIYCYLDTYNILDPPSNPYDSPGSCSPSSQTRPFFLDTSHITSSTVSHWRLKQQPIGASENSFSFLAFCQSL